MIPRSDKVRNQAAVLKSMIQDPELDQRERAKRLEVTQCTISNHMKEICQNLSKEQAVMALVKADMDIQMSIAEEKKRRLQRPEQINNTDLDRWEATALKRSQILTGGATERFDTVDSARLRALDAMAKETE